MTTHAEAVGDYQRLKARGGVVADPSPAPSPPVDPPFEKTSGAAQKAAELAAIALLTPAGREAEAERVAAARLQMPTPAPRELLRQAHRQRADAQHEAHRLQAALDRARAHLDEVTANRDAAQQTLDDVEAADTARLIEELANGAGRVEAGGGAERLALAEAEHVLEIASRAADKLAGDLASAEQQLATARTKVTEAVCSVMLDEAQRQAVEILAAADELDARRAGLDALGLEITNLQRRSAVRAPWPPSIREALMPELRAAPRLPSRFATPAGNAQASRWSAIATALAADPEAAVEDMP